MKTRFKLISSESLIQWGVNAVVCNLALAFIASWSKHDLWSVTEGNGTVTQWMLFNVSWMSYSEEDRSKGLNISILWLNLAFAAMKIVEKPEENND